MACCENHDRMDRVLSSTEFNDAQCGVPTNPRGEPRYCCRQCPAHGKPLAIHGRWASNPVLMNHLTEDERREVMNLAMASGPMEVDIVTSVPAPAANALPTP